MTQLKLLITASCLLFVGLASLQAQKAVPASGGEIDDTGGSLSYSVGQSIVVNALSASGSVGGGVQQPFQVLVIAGVENKSILLNIHVSAYPNPAIDFLTIKVGDQTEAISALLFDINGTLLRSAPIDNNRGLMDVQDLDGGMYILRVSGNTGQLKTFQILKK